VGFFILKFLTIEIDKYMWSVYYLIKED